MNRAPGIKRNWGLTKDVTCRYAGCESEVTVAQHQPDEVRKSVFALHHTESSCYTS